MSNPNTPETPDTPENSDSAGLQEGAGSAADQPQPSEPNQQPNQPPQYAPPQYAPPQHYAQPQPPQYSAPQYLPPQAPQNGQQNYGQAPQQQSQQYAYQQPQYAQPQYAAPLPTPGPGEPFDGALYANELHRPLYGASFGQAFTRFFKNYANFTGRASRSEYWWMMLIFFLGYIAFVIVAAIFSGVLDRADPYGRSGGDIIGGLFGVTLILAMLGLIVPTIALHWRRLHDANFAGPLYLLTLIPWVGSLIVFIFTLLSPKPEGRRFDSQYR